jgi:antitoxin PrlF
LQGLPEAQVLWTALDTTRSVHYNSSNALRVRSTTVATVTRKGQITLPRAIREALGVETGAEVDFELCRDGVLLRKKPPREAFEQWRGYLVRQGNHATTDELLEELRQR